MEVEKIKLLWAVKIEWQKVVLEEVLSNVSLSFFEKRSCFLLCNIKLSSSCSIFLRFLSSVYIFSPQHATWILLQLESGCTLTKKIYIYTMWFESKGKIMMLFFLATSFLLPYVVFFLSLYTSLARSLMIWGFNFVQQINDVYCVTSNAISITRIKKQARDKVQIRH